MSGITILEGPFISLPGENRHVAAMLSENGKTPFYDWRFAESICHTPRADFYIESGLYWDVPAGPLNDLKDVMACMDEWSPDQYYFSSETPPAELFKRHLRGESCERMPLNCVTSILMALTQAGISCPIVDLDGVTTPFGIKSRARMAVSGPQMHWQAVAGGFALYRPYTAPTPFRLCP